MDAKGLKWIIETNSSHQNITVRFKLHWAIVFGEEVPSPTPSLGACVKAWFLLLAAFSVVIWRNVCFCRKLLSFDGFRMRVDYRRVVNCGRRGLREEQGPL